MSEPEAATTSDTLDRLESRVEILDVLARYARGIDRLDRELVVSCYHPDAVDEHGMYGGRVVDFVDSAFERQAGIEMSSHCMFQSLVEFPGPDVAAVETYARAVERHLTDPPGGLRDDVVGLRYLDRMERRASGRWLIAHRTVIIDWTQSRAVDAGWLAEQPLTRGRRDAEDPSWRLLANDALLRPGQTAR